MFREKWNDIVNRIVNCIEDPIADCFMINIGNITASEYLSIVLQQNWYIWLKLKNQKPSSYEDFCTFCMKNLQQRVFPNLFALYLGNNDCISEENHDYLFTLKQKYINAAWEKIKQLFDAQMEQAKRRNPLLDSLLKERSEAVILNNEKRIKEINEQLKLLEMEEIFEIDYQNSLIPLANYIKKLHYQHQHYLEIREKPDPAIETIRLFNCRRDHLLRFRLRKYDRSQKTDLRQPS